MSVVVAAYNEEAHIARLLTSLKRQSIPPCEVIVVDDGSRDGTRDVAAAHAAKVVTVAHRCPARARNIGARLARGEILVFLDGDMRCADDFIERLTSPIIAESAVGTFTKDLWVGNPENDWARSYCAIRRLPFPRLLPRTFPDEWANFRAILREPFLAVGGYDDVGYGEDMTLAPKLAVTAVAAEGAVCWHFNPDSLREIFENGRWIGRGADIAQVPHPWRDNMPWTALMKALRDRARGYPLRVVLARLVYHAGILMGLGARRLRPWVHWK